MKPTIRPFTTNNPSPYNQQSVPLQPTIRPLIGAETRSWQGFPDVEKEKTVNVLKTIQYRIAFIPENERPVAPAAVGKPEVIEQLPAGSHCHVLEQREVWKYRKPQPQSPGRLLLPAWRIPS